MRYNITFVNQVIEIILIGMITKYNECININPAAGTTFRIVIEKLIDTFWPVRFENSLQHDGVMKSKDDDIVCICYKQAVYHLF